MAVKILFAGTPEFALPSLHTVRERFEITGVLTQAAAGKGRGRQRLPSPVKVEAETRGLRVFEPEKLDRDFLKIVASLSPDLLVCVAYGKIFKKEFLDLFPLGGINVHPSLLPRHRGPSPIPAAILCGDPETGVTVQRLALMMDTGDVLAREEIRLSGEETAATLGPVLAERGAALLPPVIERIAAGTIQETKQDENAATYCKLIRKEDGELSFTENALEISRMIRAYTPWPLVSTRWKGSRLFLLSGGVYPRPFSAAADPVPGLVLGMDKDYGFLIHTCNGILFVRELQREYKKPLFFKDFLNGNRDFPGSVCGGSA